MHQSLSSQGKASFPTNDVPIKEAYIWSRRFCSESKSTSNVIGSSPAEVPFHSASSSMNWRIHRLKCRRLKATKALLLITRAFRENPILPYGSRPYLKPSLFVIREWLTDQHFISHSWIQDMGISGKSPYSKSFLGEENGSL